MCEAGRGRFKNTKLDGRPNDCSKPSPSLARSGELDKGENSSFQNSISSIANQGERYPKDHVWDSLRSV